MPDLTYNYAHCWERMYKGIDGNGPYSLVSYRFDSWADSDAVANQLRGYTQQLGTTTVRVPPHSHPLSPNLYCVDCRIEGLGAPVLNAAGHPSYSSGFLAHCEYRGVPAAAFGGCPPNEMDPEKPILWATQELDFSTEEYLQEKNQYKWSTGDALNGKMSGVPVRASIGVTTMNITYHQLPYLPVGIVRSLRNKLNNATFMLAPPYHIRFMGARTVREVNTDGTIAQRVQIQFKEREVDWNKFLRKDKLQWDYIVDDDGNKVFSTANLAPLVEL